MVLAAWLVVAPGLSGHLTAASPQDHGKAAASAPPSHETPVEQPAHGAPAETAAPANAASHAAPQGSPGHAAEAQHGAAGEHGESHGESPWATVARLFNFALLAGGLVYFLRSPAAEFLKNRGIQIRSDLAKAAEMRASASAQLTTIEQKMAALPRELDDLKRRGVEEIAAEEGRIRDMAQQERERMLAQARREVDVQLRLAERELARRTGELAVDVATARVKQTITDQDQARLVQRYLQQVRN